MCLKASPPAPPCKAPYDRGAPILDYLVEWWRAEDGGQAEVEVVQVAAAGPLRGTFVVRYQGEATDTLPWDAAEETVEAALEALPSLRDVQVRKSPRLPARRGHDALTPSPSAPS